MAATIEHQEPLSRIQADTIVDVGANRGQFAIFARHLLPDCTILAFEPLERPANTFELLFRDDPKTRLARAAVASKRGSLTMHVTAADDSSSGFEVGDLQRQAFGTAVVETRDVPCGPLSDFLGPTDLVGRCLMKVDVQGFELEVLRGAEEMLDRFSAIYCELSFVELYVGQPLASEVIAYLHGRNFDLAGVYNIATTREAGPIQADMLFMRRDRTGPT